MTVSAILRELLSPLSPSGKWLRLARIAVKPLRMHDVIHRQALREPGLSFVQIGANDGVAADPLHAFIETFGWTGAMVEPQPYVFSEKLEPLYQHNKKIHLVNAAIGPEAGTMPLYVLSFSNARWATGKATLERAVLQKLVDSGWIGNLAKENGVKAPADLDEWITSIDVPVLTVDELLTSTGVTDFDLLHVDTEGADAMIVQQFDFAKLSARLVQFEHIHLSDSDLASTCAHLNQAGFQLHMNKMNVLATRGIKVHRTSMAALSEPWQRAEHD